MRVLVVFLRGISGVVLALCRPGGVRSVVAENLLLRFQLSVLNRSSTRCPNLSGSQRVFLGFLCQFIPKRRFLKVACVFRPSTLLRIHRCFRDRKYKRIFGKQVRLKPGPKGPDRDLINAILDLKRRNPRMGCPRIAQQISAVFGVEIDKDVVRRILVSHFKPCSGNDDPSWLSFLGHCKDSLWSVDLFRAESVLLKSYWVMVVMDQYSRRIIGFAVQPVSVDGAALCRMFNQIILGNSFPKRLSLDSDPLYDFKQWKANLRILEISAVSSVPHVPVSHPFVERLIGTICREYLDQVFFWNSIDLSRKLEEFRIYFNGSRVHAGIDGKIPDIRAGEEKPQTASLHEYRWESHCNGLFQTPMAA